MARGSSARALPPDVYNLGRLSGGNKRVAPVGQPRTPATRAALMRGDAATGQLSTKAKTSKAKADMPQSSFDINEIVAGLRAALESAESDEERDVELNEQLATLRPFVLLSKNCKQGNPPNKKELFALIMKNGLAQELADAVIAAGR